MARSTVPQAFTAPSRSVYNGMMQRTYAEYTHNLKYGYTHVTNVPGAVDLIEHALFWNGNLSGMCSVDGILNGLVFAHEYYKIAYVGLCIKPQINTMVPNTATVTGDIAMVPVVKPSTFAFAFAATAGSPTYVPNYLDQLLRTTEGTVRSAGLDMNSRWLKKFQPGILCGDQVVNPNFGGSSGYTSRPRMQRFDWTNIWPLNYSPPILNTLDNTLLWSPCIVFANWGGSASLPIGFLFELNIKVQLKGRRLNLYAGGPANFEDYKHPESKYHMRCGDHPENLKIHGSDASEVKLEVEEYVDPHLPVDEEDEKMILAEHAAQKKRLEDFGKEKEPALRRTLTNLNLGVIKAPTVGSKRTSEMSTK